MLLRKFRHLLCALALCAPLAAAPLFPDVPEDHWARDAVAALAARGLVEGYPDGTFKGDRAASRWETAIVVARLLAKMEQTHATFATRLELDELRKLVNALREELDALGVRVGNLEENVSRLDKRVSELERITFYGLLETHVVMQSFQNDGAADNDAGRFGAGAPGTVPYINYNSVIGSRVSAPFRPQVQGIMATVDYRNGRALSNGTGFTALGVLGVNIDVTDELEAGLELAGYSSQGDEVVDAYWGVSAPFLLNPFTRLSGAAQPLDNTPFTRMTLDRFWVHHKPSKTRLTVGSIDKTQIDSFVWAGQGNLGVFGPRRFPGFGFQVLGGVDLEGSRLSYEVLGTRLGHGVRFEGASYQNTNLAGNVAWHFDQGKAQVNFSRYAEGPPPGGGALVTGLTNGMNTAYGASNGWTQRQWVNPPGYYVNQLSAYQRANIGTIGNTTDPRPITGWNGTVDNAVGFGPGAGNYGPEAQTTFGLSAHHRFALGEENGLTVGGEFGHSEFRPNLNSPYSAGGDLLRVYLEASLLKKNLDLGVEYLSVDPTYNPAAWSGLVTGVRFIDTFNFTGVGHIYDSGRYPHNREGFRGNARYRFGEGKGEVFGRLAFLDQTRTSLYDVRVTPGALGLDTPNFPVIGMAPGFVDPVFYGFAHPSQYGAASRNAFTPNLEPLENPRGSQDEWEIGGSYKFAAPKLKLTVSYRDYEFRRGSSLSAALGGSQNLVDIDTGSFFFDLAWEASPKVTLSTGLDLVGARGHYDPVGLYNGYALATGQTDFTNFDSEQTIPHLAVDWRVNETTTANLTGRYYITRDNVDPSIGTGSAALGQVGSTAHPFSWSGVQVISELKIKF